MGLCKLHCNYKGNTHELDFQVVGIDQTPLLSVKTCEQLGLLSVHVCQSVDSVEQTDIMAKFSDVFTGPGCLPGNYHIEMDSSVKPVQHQPRKVAVALKPELQNKIKELEQKGHHHHHFGRSRAARLALQSALLAIQLANSLESTAPTSLFKVFTKVEGGRPLLLSPCRGSHRIRSPVRLECLKQCPARPRRLHAILSETHGREAYSIGILRKCPERT